MNQTVNWVGIDPGLHGAVVQLDGSMRATGVFRTPIIEGGEGAKSQYDERAMAALVRQLRRVSLNPDLRVMVGGRPFEEHPEWATLVGADATARDGRDAVAKAQGLLDLSHRRN